MTLLEDINYQKTTMKCNCRLLCSAEIAAKRIKELKGVMAIIQTEASEGLATMKNEERPDIQRLLRRISTFLFSCCRTRCLYYSLETDNFTQSSPER